MNQSNQPCECGSGRKQKRCHPFGAPAYGPVPEPARPLTVAERAEARRRDMEVRATLAGFMCLFGSVPILRR